jgi:hypothetical protein
MAKRDSSRRIVGFTKQTYVPAPALLLVNIGKEHVDRYCNRAIPPPNTAFGGPFSVGATYHVHLGVLYSLLSFCAVPT